jgi:hypothetical protein
VLLARIASPHRFQFPVVFGSLVAIMPEKEFGKWLYSFSAKDNSSSQRYLPSRSAKKLLQAEGERQVARFLR